MSEYQYYEFQAIDRPLTPGAQQAVAQLSSRVSPHPWRAVFTYSYGGGLRRNPEDLLADYYDAMLYLANWGSRRLMFRFPRSLVDADRMRQYNVETTEYPSDVVQVDTKGEYVILDIQLNEEEGLGWIEDEGWLGSLVGLREAMMRGDDRVLYLAWLKGLTMVYGADEDAFEPPVPPGLGDLTPALETFVELFDVEADMLQAAAERSAPLEPRTLTEDDLRRAIDALAPEEKDECLLRLAQGEPQLALALKRRLGLLDSAGPQRSTEARRTVAELFAEAEAIAERRRKAEAAAAEARRIAELEALAERGDEVWDEVDALIQRGQAKFYDKAVQLLKKLRDLAEHQRKTVVFQTRLNRIHDEYSRRSALMRRLRNAGLHTE
ncbi:MAG TPA: hypothetical protein ENN19_06285 [Chloroflexi bacterium]|nr:hypothetical protein [Chloroflexota bacterium]